MASLLDRIRRRALRPVDALYYRFLAGRAFAGEAAPWVQRLGASVLAREQASGRGDVPLPQHSWDEQYGAGQWDFLDRRDEIPRYALIAGFVAALPGRPAVLDVGCGEGLLLRHLPTERIGDYLGIDLSATAVERGRQRIDSSTAAEARFQAVDAERFETSRRWDAIVLNECLYYFHQPTAQAARYFEMLAPHGLMIVSMFQHRRSRAIEHQLAKTLPQGDRFDLSHSKGSWSISLYQAP